MVNVILSSSVLAFRLTCNCSSDASAGSRISWYNGLSLLSTMYTLLTSTRSCHTFFAVSMLRRSMYSSPCSGIGWSGLGKFFAEVMEGGKLNLLLHVTWRYRLAATVLQLGMLWLTGLKPFHIDYVELFLLAPPQTANHLRYTELEVHQHKLFYTIVTNISSGQAIVHSSRFIVSQ